MAVLMSENFGDTLEPGLFEITTQDYMQKEQMRPMLYNVRSSSTSYEKTSAVGTVGDLEPFTGSVSYDTVYQGEDVQFNPVEFTRGIKIERRIYEDDLYGVIADRASDLGTAVWRTEEKWGAHIFNTAFAGTGTIVVGCITVLNNTEAQALCSTAHTGGTARLSTTYSNEDTLELTATAVETVRQRMAAFVDDAGNKIQVIPDLLLVPRGKEEKAFQIISSRGQVDSANNNVNFHYGKYKMATWDYLTSSTAWFFISSQMMKKHLLWFNRIAPEFSQDKDFDSMVAKYMVYERFSFGWRNWRWVYGCNATT